MYNYDSVKRRAYVRNNNRRTPPRKIQLECHQVKLLSPAISTVPIFINDVWNKLHGMQSHQRNPRSTPPTLKCTAPQDPHWRETVGRRADDVYCWCPMTQSVLQDTMPYKQFICPDFLLPLLALTANPPPRDDDQAFLRAVGCTRSLLYSAIFPL